MAATLALTRAEVVALEWSLLSPIRCRQKSVAEEEKKALLEKMSKPSRRGRPCKPDNPTHILGASDRKWIGQVRNKPRDFGRKNAARRAGRRATRDKTGKDLQRAYKIVASQNAIRHSFVVGKPSGFIRCGAARLESQSARRSAGQERSTRPPPTPLGRKSGARFRARLGPQLSKVLNGGSAPQSSSPILLSLLRHGRSLRILRLRPIAGRAPSGTSSRAASIE